jgi:P27 family predicted phage terminase small subunit
MAQRGRKSQAKLSVVGLEPAILRPALPPNQTKPPAHLGKVEQEIWQHVLAGYEQTAVANDVLIVTLEAHQRARQARETVDREGMTVIGRDGQTKVHPLLAVERDARQAFFAGIKALGIEL